MQKSMLTFGVMLLVALLFLRMEDVGAATLTPGDIVVDDEAGTILLIDGETGVQTLVTSGGVLGITQGLAIDAAGRILVVDLCVQSVAPGVVRINPATGVQTIVTMGDLLGNGCQGGPAHIAIDPDGDILVAGSFTAGTNNNQIIRIDPVTGDQALVPLIGTLPSTPRGLAVVPIRQGKKK